MILVVGGAGYVGSVLVRELLSRGFQVRVFDRLYYGAAGLEAIKDRIEIISGDMRAMPENVLADVSAVINLGGLSNDPTAEYNPRANREMNTAATEALAVQCKRRGISRFILASSCSIYDVGAGNDEKDILLNETSPVNPTAAYSSSKYEAERILLSMADSSFAPVCLRKGTIFGFSPRMRYDLVVNTFIKDALSKGRITVHNGGEMWRPLLDICDAARAYAACLLCDEELIRGQIFNLVCGNYRISELALRVRSVLSGMGIPCEVKADYRYQGVRSYRVSGAKMERILGFKPSVSLEESVGTIVEKIRDFEYLDFDNPKYHNIAWMKILEQAQKTIDITGTIFGSPAEGPEPVRTMRARA